MKLKELLAGIAILPALAMPAAASRGAHTTAVADWTGNGYDAIAATTKFPAKEAVYMAIVSATIYDAVVTVERSSRPYGDVHVVAPRGASRDASVTAAAHDMLVELFPERRAQLDALSERSLERIPAGPAKAAGLEAGRAVAVQLRASPTIASAISTLQAPEHYAQRPPGPGVYEPTGPPPIGTTMAEVPPLVLGSASQFRPDGPSAPTSEAYAKDLSEVMLLGRKDSAVRTSEQTLTAWFWTDLDVPQWNRAMLQLAAERRLRPLATAQMLALANLAGADAMIACFDAKYHESFWRPVHAIRRADTDGNPATVGDPDWEPLFSTPPFPEYPSAHNCHSGAITRALARFFGTDRVRFAVDTFTTAPPPAGCSACLVGTLRSYDRFGAALEDVINARVWAGLHFRQSDEAGAFVGRSVGEYVAERFLERCRRS